MYAFCPVSVLLRKSRIPYDKHLRDGSCDSNCKVFFSKYPQALLLSSPWEMRGVGDEGGMKEGGAGGGWGVGRERITSYL